MYSLVPSLTSDKDSGTQVQAVGSAPFPLSPQQGGSGTANRDVREPCVRAPAFSSRHHPSVTSTSSISYIHPSILFRPPCAWLGVMRTPTRTGTQRTEMGFVNYEPFIRFRQLTKLSHPGGRVSDRVTRSRVHALPILYREGPKHMCTCALSTVGRSGILRRFRGATPPWDEPFP